MWGYVKTGFLICLTIALMVCALLFCVNIINENDRKSAAYENKLFDKANKACGEVRPSDIDTINSSWSYSAYLKVTCPDGSVQVIK